MGRYLSISFLFICESCCSALFLCRVLLYVFDFEKPEALRAFTGEERASFTNRREIEFKGIENGLHCIMRICISFHICDDG